MNTTKSFFNDAAAADSIFAERGGLTRAISRAPSALFSSLTLAGPSEPVRKVLLIVGYILMAFVAAAILIYLVNAVYPIWDLYGIQTPFGPGYKSERYWTNLILPEGAAPPAALYVSPTDSITRRPAQYTIMFDIYIQTSKAPGLGSYRHIVHRGSDDYNQMTEAAAALGRVGNTSSAKAFEASVASAASTKGVPLPNFMNPGIFLHPYRNDIVFFFQTEAAQKRVIGYDVLYLESAALDDVPLLEWFRVTLTVKGNVVDIYKNGRLMRSMILKGEPRAVSNQWFGRSGPVPFYGAVINMKLWDGALAPSEVAKEASGAFPLVPKIPAITADETCSS